MGEKTGDSKPRNNVCAPARRALTPLIYCRPGDGAGGNKSIIPWCGKDVTAEWPKRHPAKSGALSMLAIYQVGVAVQG